MSKKIVLSLIALVFGLVPVYVTAQSTGQNNISNIVFEPHFVGVVLGASTSGDCQIPTRTLRKNQRNADVSRLQNFLVSQGYLSADNATGYFGPATEQAVKRFQSQNGIISYGNAQTTGYGSVGTRTLNAMRAACNNGGSSGSGATSGQGSGQTSGGSTMPSGTNKCGPNGMTLSEMCDGGNYRYAEVTCYDGSTTVLGGPTSCKPSSLWEQYAITACSNKCAAPKNDPTNTPIDSCVGLLCTVYVPNQSDDGSTNSQSPADQYNEWLRNSLSETNQNTDPVAPNAAPTLTYVNSNSQGVVVQFVNFPGNAKLVLVNAVSNTVFATQPQVIDYMHNGTWSIPFPPTPPNGSYYVRAQDNTTSAFIAKTANFSITTSNQGNTTPSDTTAGNTTNDNSISTPVFTAAANTPTSGPGPLTVTFQGNNLPCGTYTLAYGDNDSKSVTTNCATGATKSGPLNFGSHTYTAAKKYGATLKKGSTTYGPISINVTTPDAPVTPMTITDVKMNWVNGPQWALNSAAVYGSYTITNSQFGYVRFSLVGEDGKVYMRSDDDPFTNPSKAMSAHNGTQTFEWNLPGRNCNNGTCTIDQSKLVPAGNYSLNVSVINANKVVIGVGSVAIKVNDANAPVSSCSVRAVGATGKDGSYVVMWTTQNASSASLNVSGIPSQSVPVNGSMRILMGATPVQRTISLTIVGNGYSNTPCSTIYNEPLQLADAKDPGQPNGGHATADACTNIAGDQTSIPSGMTYSDSLGCIDPNSPLLTQDLNQTQNTSCSIKAVGATGKDGTYVVWWTSTNAKSAWIKVDGNADVAVPLTGSKVIQMATPPRSRVISLSIQSELGEHFGTKDTPCSTTFNEPLQLADAKAPSQPNGGHATADACTNIAGDQSTIPSGYTYNAGGACVSDGSTPAGGSTGTAAQRVFFASLYTCILNRSAADGEITNWINQNVKTPYDAYYGFFMSYEYTNKNKSPADFVSDLYSCVLKRQPDENGAAGWISRLQQGMSRAQVISGFTNSPEFLNASAPEIQTILNGTSASTMKMNQVASALSAIEDALNAIIAALR